MKISEITEGVTTVFSKSGNKAVRKYRCTSGSRKGRIVAKPSTCTAPKNVKQSVKMKKTRRRKGKTPSIRASRTKRTNPISTRLGRLNTGRTIKPKKRPGKRKRT